MKPLLDCSLAFAGLVLLLPLLCVLVVLVRLTSRGPAIYAQLRVGRGGRLFYVYKIRSMYHDCEKATGPIWAGPRDGRVTPLGRLLRSAYLDELPQLVNVLRGEMSLVGPRPERPEIIAKLKKYFPADYCKRISVKPGMTGIAQIRQAADTSVADVRRKLHYDLLYLRRVNLLLDLQAILATPLPVLRLRRPRRRLVRQPIAPPAAVQRAASAMTAARDLPAPEPCTIDC